MTQPRTTPAEQLRQAVAALTRPARRKIMRDAIGGEPPRTISATVPSLLDQLDEARETGSEGGGARGVPGSRPPVGEDVLAVLLAIEAGTAGRRMYAGLPLVDDTAEGLRNLAEHVIAGWPDDQIAELADLARGWVRAARSALGIAYAARGIRGVPCPDCRVAWVDSPDGGGREYALIVTFSGGGMVRAAECRSCGTTWWRGQALELLGTYVQSYAAATDAVIMFDRPA